MVNLMQVPADRAFRIPQRPGNLADGPAFRQQGGDLALHRRQPQGRGHHSRIDAGRVARGSTTNPRTTIAICVIVSKGRTLCRPENSFTYRLRGLMLIL